MYLAHFIPYLAPEFGGPVSALAAMVEGLSAQGQQVSVFAGRGTGEGAPVGLAAEAVLTLGEDLTWGPLRHSPRLWQVGARAGVELIHSHGLWTDVHRCAAVLARRQGVPHLLGPCGMLDAAALRRSRWKKRLVGAWFQSRALAEASGLLANSEQEYRDIRRYGLMNPVAVLPNPVSGPEVWGSLAGDRVQDAPLPPGRRTVLFLGRLHPVKGLMRLVAAWGRLGACHAAWQLVLAGPDEGGYRAVLEDRLRALGCQSSVHLIGPLDAGAKWRALHQADLFVMPSDFENFGLAIVEAMLARTPVITTTGTPWSALAEQGAGWWIEPTEAALERTLAEAMQLSDEERTAMGQRGEEMAQAFAPDRIALQLITLYRWLLRQGECPDFVRLD